MDNQWLEELEMYDEVNGSNEFELEMVARAMEKAKRVTVLTGAGISDEINNKVNVVKIVV